MDAQTAKYKSMFPLLIVLVFVTSCAESATNHKTGGSNANSTVNAVAEMPAIEFRSGQVSTTLTFSEAEMDQIEKEMRAGNSKGAEDYIMQKLASAGKKCCEPRKRLDECTWQCCDKAIVKTCNRKLAAALEHW